MTPDFNIQAPNPSLRGAIAQKIDNLNKPKGSLGVLEDLALQVALAQQTLHPQLCHPCHLLLGADHGIEREGVSVSPRCVTWQQMLNFTRGGGGVNMFCRQHGFKLSIVDVGVDYDFAPGCGIIDRKIAHGTQNFLHGPAMTTEQFDCALTVGVDFVDAFHRDGCNILAIGEMGIANTSPSSIWMSQLCHIPLEQCIGAGAGLDSKGISHKRDVLQAALQNYQNSQQHDLPTLLRYFGGFEMVAAIGAMLRAAELHLIILIDGFIMTACALATIEWHPEARHYMVFAHVGDESGHRAMLNYLNVRPLLALGMRLGEGTGALCAYPIVESAVNMINEMDNFSHANITKYF